MPAVENLLTFLQNGNVVVIKRFDDFYHFLQILERHGLIGLLPRNYPRHWGMAISLAFQSTKRERQNGEWDGKTLYAECQIGKESIGIYPYTTRATVEWYGTEPLTVDDIDSTAPPGAAPLP